VNLAHLRLVWGKNGQHVKLELREGSRASAGAGAASAAAAKKLSRTRRVAKEGAWSWRERSAGIPSSGTLRVLAWAANYCHPSPSPIRCWQSRVPKVICPKVSPYEYKLTINNPFYTFQFSSFIKPPSPVFLSLHTLSSLVHTLLSLNFFPPSSQLLSRCMRPPRRSQLWRSPSSSLN